MVSESVMGQKVQASSTGVPLTTRLISIGCALLPPVRLPKLTLSVSGAERKYSGSGGWESSRFGIASMVKVSVSVMRIAVLVTALAAAAESKDSSTIVYSPGS